MRQSRLPDSLLLKRTHLGPAVGLLVAALLLPAAAVLWFMNQAMENERLAARQRLSSAYRSRLQGVADRVSDAAAEIRTRLDSRDPVLPAGETFAKLIEESRIRSVVLFDATGSVRFPSRATPRVVRRHRHWQPAWDLEFVRADPGGAARLYQTIAAATAGSERATALQAAARCLASAGMRSEAIGILKALVFEARYAATTDETGSSVPHNAALFAIRLADDDASRQAMLDWLIAEVRRYRDSPLPSDQRLFLMGELARLTPETTFETREAEQLAVAYLDRGTGVGLESTWRVASIDGQTLALVPIGELEDIAAASDADDDSVVRLLEAGSEQLAAAFLVEPVGSAAPDLRVALFLPDSRLPAAEGSGSAYFWVATLVIAGLAGLIGLIARQLRSQLQIARLRNDLLATVTHELKTPLSSTRAMVDTLLEGRVSDATTTREYLQLIGRENERLSRLIDNFLTFSRLQVRRQMPSGDLLDISEVVDRAREVVLDRFADGDSRLTVDVAADLPRVRGDRDALVTVLVNLLENAHKYSGDRKFVTVRACCDNGSICIEVEDNGIGIPRRQSRRIFDRFYQVDSSLARRGNGCGLGLSIVKFVVEAHHGSVSVESAPDHGSTFRVLLPSFEGKRT